MLLKFSDHAFCANYQQKFVVLVKNARASDYNSGIMTLQLADNYYTVLTMLPENGGLCYDEIMLMKYKEELRYLKELGFVHSIEVEHLDYFMAAYLTPAGAAYLLDVKTPVAPEVTEQDNVNHELLLKVTRAEAFAIIAVFLSLLGTIISLVNAFRH